MPVLLAIHASTRTEELALFDWPEAQKSAFLDMQGRLQHADYARNYPNAVWWMIEQDGSAAGRLALDRREASDHILDIALLPGFRNKGLGGALLADVIEAATQEGKAVTLQVMDFNPAVRLYERLGFERVEEQPPFLRMRRNCRLV